VIITSHMRIDHEHLDYIFLLHNEQTIFTFNWVDLAQMLCNKKKYIRLSSLKPFQELEIEINI